MLYWRFVVVLLLSLWNRRHSVIPSSVHDSSCYSFPPPWHSSLAFLSTSRTPSTVICTILYERRFQWPYRDSFFFLKQYLLFPLIENTLHTTWQWRLSVAWTHVSPSLASIPLSASFAQSVKFNRGSSVNEWVCWMIEHSSLQTIKVRNLSGNNDLLNGNKMESSVSSTYPWSFAPPTRIPAISQINKTNWLTRNLYRYQGML